MEQGNRRGQFGRKLIKKIPFHLLRLKKYETQKQEKSPYGGFKRLKEVKEQFVGLARRRRRAYGAFQRHGGKLNAEQYDYYIKNAPHIRSKQIEKMRSIIEHPRYPGKTKLTDSITEEQLTQKLEEMTKNKEDPLSRKELGSIKRLFFG